MSESNPSAPRTARSSRGLFIGGGALLVGLGIWLGSLFNGFGLGPGDGGGPGDGPNSTDVSDKVDPRSPNDDPSDDPKDDAPGDRDGALHIVMSGDGYSLEVTSDDGKVGLVDATLREIVVDAVASKPNENGHRVVITGKRPVSKGTHQDLIRQLEEAGLEPDEIHGYDFKDVVER